MEEGSLRCDANISIRPKGETKLGTRVEVKNLNSIRNVKKAIEVELERLTAMDRRGEKILQETRSFDADKDRTFTIRTKEDADDYRYFPDPDLTPFRFTEEDIERIRQSLPALPEALAAAWTSNLGLGEYDAHELTGDKELADYFTQSLGSGAPPKVLANFLLGPLRSWLHENHQSWIDVRIPPQAWQELARLVEEGRISFSAAASRLLPELAAQPAVSPVELATRLDLLQDAGQDDIRKWVTEVLASMPDKVAEYRKGKKGLIGLFMGEVKKISRGKADPRKTNDALIEALQKNP
jgi:aspartyl-tRNA(Asn)/glutamyl-tRNA(Gln) amidotransferase subunit B